MSKKIHRRDFFRKVGAGAALGVAWPRPVRHSFDSVRPVSPNERIGLGMIGVGSLGGGGHHLGRVLGMPDFDVVAVCDVDRDYLQKAVAKTGGRAKGYRDFRLLLQRQDIDAVIIATPDHWHALTAIRACETGKDVYCEKPVSLTVADGRAMADAARRYGTVFQVGTQQRSGSRFRWACELVRNGRIGKVESVKTVLGRGPTSKWVSNAAPPQTLDWDFWLGPAPKIPYNPKRCHYQFRWFYDYSGGKMTDWGAHHLDIAQWGLGTELSGPVEVEATGTWPNSNFFETAVDFDVRYRYANGVELHATGAGENGITFKGSEGTVFVSRSKIWADPVEILETEVGAGPIVLYESNNHHGNWLECLRTRARPISDVEIGHRSASVGHIGNISMRLGRKLEWDPVAERFVGDEGANRMLYRPMRGPWSL